VAEDAGAPGASPRRPLPPGFTLLEIVIALTALALVTVICYGAFHLGIRAMERGEVAVVAAQRLRVATDVIIRQVKSIVPYKARNRDDEEYVFFMGRPARWRSSPAPASRAEAASCASSTR